MKVVQNTFLNNVGLVDSNIINFRSLTDGPETLFKTNYTDRSVEGCGGLLVQGNIFNESVGCRFTNGAIYGYCLAKNRKEDPRLVYNTEIDSQYFSDESRFDSSLTSETKTLVSMTSDVMLKAPEDQFKSHNVILLEQNKYLRNIAGS